MVELPSVNLRNQVPTERDEVVMTVRTTGRVLSNPRWFLVALLGGIVGLFFIVAAQNPDLILDLVVLSGLPLASKFGVVYGLMPFISPGWTLTSSWLTVLIAGVIGVNFSMMGYNLTAGGLALREGGTSTFGSILAILGVGCTACGLPIIGELAIIFGIAGASTSLAWLPFGGTEFTVGALLLLLLSLYWVANKINQTGAACAVDLDLDEA